jgi:hypothetical protein
VGPTAAKRPLGKAERARRGAINRCPAPIRRGKSKKISATILNDAFFSSLLTSLQGFRPVLATGNPKGCLLRSMAISAERM